MQGAKRILSDPQPGFKKAREDKSIFEEQLEKLHELSGNVLMQNWEESWKRPAVVPQHDFSFQQMEVDENVWYEELN